MNLVMRCLQLCLCLLSCVLMTEAHGRIRLRDIEVLTLREGKHTASRRVAPIPQLKCVGGTAGSKYDQPKHVQCYNRGWDGHDVQWECKAEMGKKYQFGSVEVVCEGYDYPEDPNILSGSCGLEYELDYANTGSHSSGSIWTKSQDNNFGLFGLIVVVGIAGVIIYIIYNACISNQSSDNDPSAPPPPYSDSYGAPPSYGWRNDSNTGSGSNCYGSGTNTRQQQSPFGGFWTGLGTGGLLGYMFGGNRGSNRGYNSGYQHTPNYNTGSGSSWFSGSSGGGSGYSSPSTSSSTHTSSGFGGTRRR